MGRMGSAPNFAYVGESTRPKCLILGVYENSIRRVIELPANTSTSAVVSYKRGQVLFRDRMGAISPLTLTSVTAEAVGTGNGVLTEFTLDHSPIVASSLEVKVGGTLTTLDYTLNDVTGTITFAEAPADTLAITASYDYFSHSTADFPHVVPLIIEWDAEVPKKVGIVNGTGTASVVIKGEVSSDQLLVGEIPWGELSADAKVQLENVLTVSGLVPGAVVR